MLDYEFNLEDDASCVKCGHKLSWGERSNCLSADAPPACANHFQEAWDESRDLNSMWPADWHGHSYQSPLGSWWIETNE